MALKDWALDLLKRLRDSGKWVSYDDPNVVMNEGDIGPYGGTALLSFIYDEEHGVLYFVWDPQLRISPNVRSLYEQAVDSLNKYINDSSDKYGQFEIGKFGDIRFSVSLDPLFEELSPDATDYVNDYAEGIYDMCGDMYLILLMAESWRDEKDVEHVLIHARSQVAGRA